MDCGVPLLREILHGRDENDEILSYRSLSENIILLLSRICHIYSGSPGRSENAISETEPTHGTVIESE